MRNIITFLTVFMLVLSWTWAKDTRDETERARDSAAVLTEMLNAPDAEIPAELLEEAKAIAVIPHVIKGAFGVGGSYGKGLVSQRKADGSWSPPSFIEVGGASFGLQIGAEATDYLLIFTNREGMEPLLKGKVKLGGEASVAAGPVGRTANAATDVTLDAAVYSYSRSKGAFAGVSLDGTVLSIDDSANENTYGKRVSAEDILINGKVSPNAVVAPFLEVLRANVPPA